MLKSPSLILGRFPFAAKTAHSNKVLNNDDEYWDTMTQIDENEVIRDDDSDEEIFWDSPTEPEEITETDMPITYKDVSKV